jgi:hypothetical protein
MEPLTRRDLTARKDITVKLSEKQHGLYGISGHVGVGHVHSHSGFVQDDSAGFAVAATILKKALPVDTTICDIQADVTTGEITVTTKGGGTGHAKPRRGLSPTEADLLRERGIGLDATYTQDAAVHVFGRMYGQGVSEVATAFQGACALAALETLVKAAPEKFHVWNERLPKRLDTAACTVLDIDGIPVALMLVINFTEGGIGPDEDYEGNTMWTDKGKMMQEVALDKVPTVVIESKAFNPALAEDLNVETILVRAQKDVDNMELAAALVAAAKQNQIPYRLCDDIMPLKPGSMKSATVALADRIIALGEEFKAVDLCQDKVRISAALAKLVSEDMGGVTFMGNTVNDSARGAGLMPHTGAIVSMIVPTKYEEYVKIPMLTPSDTDLYMTVVLEGVLAFAAGK